MISSESLKGKVKYIAKTNNLSPQEVLQMFFFERLLDRLSISKYKHNFVIKGGLIIASIIGINSRTTRDMDTTIKGMPLEKDFILKAVQDIIDIDVDDGIDFEIKSIEHIREDDEYENFRISMLAKFGKINNSMKIDVTTGDVITPADIEYSYSSMFSEKEIKIQAYPFETILAEKYESIIKRNIGNTRMRDFYDVYKLYELKKDDLKFVILSKAIKNTAIKRNSMSYMRDARDIIEEIAEDDYLNGLWNVYLRENKYTENLAFKDTLKVLRILEENISLD